MSCNEEHAIARFGGGTVDVPAMLPSGSAPVDISLLRYSVAARRALSYSRLRAVAVANCAALDREGASARRNRVVSLKG